MVHGCTLALVLLASLVSAQCQGNTGRYPTDFWLPQTTLQLGSPSLDGRAIADYLLTLREQDRQFFAVVGIVQSYSSQMKVAILGGDVIRDPAIHQALTCLVRGYKIPGGCGLLCDVEYRPVTVEVILPPTATPGWVDLAREVVFGLLGNERSRADVRLPGGQAASGLMLVESPSFGDGFFVGSLLGVPQGYSGPLEAYGLKAPGLAQVLKKALLWELLKAQATPWRP